MGWLSKEGVFDVSPVFDLLFSQTLGRVKYYRTFAPDIEIVGDSEAVVRTELDNHLRRVTLGRADYTPSFLDVGARDTVRSNLASGYEYFATDILPRSESVIAANICDCPHIESDRFDVVFSFDVFEHLQRPWDAAKECIRIAKPGGLLIHRTLFAYRYHPEPYDYWRFSSQCLEYIFTNSKEADTLVKGYDIRGRRRDRRGLFLGHKPPVDWLGGFRENWQVLWIGRKRETQ